MHEISIFQIGCKGAGLNGGGWLEEAEVCPLSSDASVLGG